MAHGHSVDGYILQPPEGGLSRLARPGVPGGFSQQYHPGRVTSLCGQFSLFYGESCTGPRRAPMLAGPEPAVPNQGRLKEALKDAHGRQMLGAALVLVVVHVRQGGVVRQGTRTRWDMYSRAWQGRACTPLWYTPAQYRFSCQHGSSRL